MSEKPTYEELEQRVKELEKESAGLKRTEEALRKSRDEFKLIVTSQQDLMVKTDTRGRILFVNLAYCAMFGKTEEELPGTSYAPLVHPDDLPHVEKAVAQLFVPSFTCAYEERAQTVDGWRWLSWTARAVLDDQGNVIALIGSGRDITDRKQAEDALRKPTPYYQRKATSWHESASVSRFPGVEEQGMQTRGVPQDAVSKRISEF